MDVKVTFRVEVIVYRIETRGNEEIDADPIIEEDVAEYEDLDDAKALAEELLTEGRLILRREE